MQGGEVRLGHAEDHDAAVNIGLTQQPAAVTRDIQADPLHGLDGISGRQLTILRGETERGDLQLLESLPSLD